MTTIELYPLGYMEKVCKFQLASPKTKIREERERERVREMERSKTSENGDSLVLRTSI